MKSTSPRRKHEAGDGFTKLPPASGTPSPASAPAPNAAPGEETTSQTPSRPGWGWRLMIFLWASSFAFLFLYEILTSIFHG